MKFLRLEIENLNSLYGAHAIDLENGLEGSPLFLIAGPTGAGKSTLLDAISLALFGATPRLTQRRGSEDSLALQALSRGAAYGRACLTFRKYGLEGPETYRATWEVWRGNKRNPKPEGTFQGPYRRLERMAGDTPILLADTYEEKKSTSLESHLDRALEGLAMQDFNRCILLAQGEFAAFLKATEGERSQILERLTRTELFKEIGARAAQRHADAKAALDRARGELGQIQVLTDEAVAGLQADHTQAEKESKRLRDAQEAGLQGLAWLQQAVLLQGDLEAARASWSAAEEERQAHQADLDRLGAFEAARDALAHLDLCRDRDQQIEGLAGRLQDGRQGLEGLRTQLDQARTAEQEQAGELKAARGQAEAAAPLIADSRSRRQAAQAAAEASKTAQDNLAIAQERLQEARNRQIQAQADREAADDRVAGAQQQMALAPWGELAGQLGSWKERQIHLDARAREIVEDLKGLERLQQDAGARAEDLKAAKARAAAHAGLESSLRAEAEACARDLGQEVQEAADTAGTRAALLKAKDKAMADHGALRRLADRLDRVQDDDSKFQEWELKRQADEDLATQADQATKDAEEAAKEKMVEAERLAGLVQDLEWSAGLALERTRLSPDLPCPLCGSLAHPALERQDQAGLDAELRDRCAAAQAQLAGLRTALDELRLRAVTKGAEAATARKTLRQALEQARQAAESLARQRQAALGEAAPLGWEEVPGPEQVDVRSRAVAEEIEHLEGRLARLEQFEAAHREAQDQLRDWASLADKLALETRNAGNALETAQVREQEEAKRLRSLQQGLVEGREAFAALLVSAGLPSDQPLAEADRRVEAHQTALVELDKAEKEQACTVSGEERVAAELKALDEAVQDRLREAGEADQARDLATACAAEALQALAMPDPDTWEEHLRTAIQDSEGSYQKAAELAGELSDSFHRSATDLKLLEAKADQLQADFDKASSNLTEAMAALGLAGEEDLAACRLPGPEAQALADLRIALLDRCTETSTAAQTLERQSARHQELRPANLAEDATAAGLQTALDELQTQLDGAKETLVLSRKALEEHRLALATQASALERLARTQREASLWARLNTLLGTNQGEAFQKFAQILNLRELLDKANARLAKLRPRYRLVPARDAQGERLAFAVRDEAHAGEERPLSTLSGGETFLVSLSLALALADYRTVRMPIETLLIDEGFGTLDPHTLGEVMGALRSLTAQGTQVGLISHVETLKGEIHARILVEPTAHGRATVRTECDRVGMMGAASDGAWVGCDRS